MNKTALITGASSGIGKEMAMIHAKNGGDLVIVARSEDKLNELKKELEEKHSIKVTAIVKDLGLPSAPKELYDEVKAAGIKVDYLVNNAGFGLVGTFYELDLEKQVAMMNLNMTSLTVLTHLFLKDFVKEGEGKILNVSSTASFQPGPGQAIYFATKSFVQFLSNALWEECRGTGVTITNLMPGATETGFGAISGMDKTPLFKKTASAHSVALDGYNGMIKGKMDVLTGVTCSQRLMFKMIPFLPKKIVLKTVKKMQDLTS
jgi:hypothetical protein